MLLQAALAGDTKEATWALMRSALPNYQEPGTGEMPLLRAARNRDMKMVELLLKFGADPNLPNKKGEVPLQLIFEDADLTLTRALLKAGASVMNVNLNNANILQAAVQGGHFKLARLYIESGHGDLNLRDENGNDLAGIAVLHVTEYPYKEEDVAEFILFLRSRGLSMERANSMKQTALDLALASGRPAVAAATDAKGMHRKEISEMHALIPEERLALAIQKNDLETAERQIPQARLAEVEEKLKLSLVALALEAKNMKLLELLVKHKANLQLPDQNGLTPLAAAIQTDNYEAAVILVSGGANPVAFSKTSGSPLFMACANNKLEFVKLFARSGADLKVTDRNGTNALMCAVHSGDIELVQFLISAGLDPSAANKKGQTAADLAASTGEIGLLRLLDRTGKHQKLLQEFTPARNNPYVGTWESTGEVSGQLKMEFNNDGTGTFLAAGDKGRIAWKTRPDFTADIYVRQQQSSFQILMKYDYTSGEILFDNEGKEVRLTKIQSAQAAPIIATNENVIPRLRVKEQKPEVGERSADGLTLLPEDLLAGGSKVLKADLSYNRLTTLDEIEQLKNLEKLNLRNNRIAQLPDSICSLRKLKIVDVADNQLTDLPDQFGLLETLTYLDLANNELQVLPGSFWRCNVLEDLNLSSNHFAEIPAPVFELPALRRLKLSNNNIQEIPSSILKLTRLTELDLSFTKITELPPEISKMNNLKVLHLQGNGLTEEQRKKMQKMAPRLAIQFEEDAIAPPSAQSPAFSIVPKKGAPPPAMPVTTKPKSAPALEPTPVARP